MPLHPWRFSRAPMAAMLCASALLGIACRGETASRMLPTLDGRASIVVAHRGACGYLPEETLEAYAKAIDLGANVVEMDLISTQDGALICRHDPNLAISTDVASHPEFAARKKTTLVDGETQTGWFAADFTLAEIKTLGAIATDAERPQQHNGLFRVVTFQEVIDLVKARSAATGRTIAVYPETKNPSYHCDLGLPLEDTVISLVKAAGWNSRSAPIYVQSFEPASLKYMRAKGLDTKMIQLIDADGVDLKTGALTFAPPYDRPNDWTKAGDNRLFSAMVTPAGLAEIKSYADGIGPWKRYIVTVKGSVDASGSVRDLNGDGLINEADATPQPATTLITDAHRAGLLVHPYTFRNESRRLARDYSDPKDEYLAFYALGVDGVFSDFADTALAAWATFAKARGE